MKKGSIVLHLLLCVCIHAALIQSSRGAPANEITAEPDEFDANVLFDDDKGRSYAHIAKLTKKPFKFVSRWVHRLGDLLDPDHVVIAAVQPAYGSSGIYYNPLSGYYPVGQIKSEDEHEEKSIVEDDSVVEDKL